MRIPKARREFSDQEAAKMVRKGFQAAQIGERLGLDEMEVRRWAKRHRLGKQLEMNEGCVTRQATPEELREAEAMSLSKRRKEMEPVAIQPKEAKEVPVIMMKAAKPVGLAAFPFKRRNEKAAEEKAAAYRMVLDDVGAEEEELRRLGGFLRRRMERYERREEDV